MATRPDISAALAMISQFASNPSDIHWKAAKQILRYLSGTVNYGICFIGSNDMSAEVKLTGFVDADFAGDIMTRRSQSG